MEGGSTAKREWHTAVGTCRGGRGAETEPAEDDGGSSECPQRRSRRRGGLLKCSLSLTGDERRGKVLAQGYNHRFYDFDDNKTYVVICTNQVQVFKFISGF